MVSGLKTIMHTFPSMGPPLPPLDSRTMKVTSAMVGADTENISKCFLARFRSSPSCKRNVTSPNAAGALCNMIARKTIISTSSWLVAAAAPRAMPSAAAWTTRPRVVVQLTGFPLRFLLCPA
jgi:hypothetical protein